MNRRDFLANLKNFCLLYGLQNVLSENSFAAAAPSRLICFVIKYTGGATDAAGPGQWITSSGGVLSPLSAYSGSLMVPLGLSAKFNAPMNSHAAPQICALSGAMSGYEMFETEYPKGNLQNYSFGSGKSIDVLIGERLQQQHKSALPYLLIGNNNTAGYMASTFSTSSWGQGGELLHAITSVQGLRAEIASRIACEKFPAPTYSARLKALQQIKKNHAVFNSRFLINKDKFANLEQNLEKIVAQNDATLARIAVRGALPCTALQTAAEPEASENNLAVFNSKMDTMYDLCVSALQDNITRVLTVNLHLSNAHHMSHYEERGSITPYYDVSRAYQASIASFLQKLQAKGLFEDSLIFCNAGSSIQDQLHNYENISAYVINGGKAGLAGAAGNRRPMGSLLADILAKFGVAATEYGGRDHSLGVGTRGIYL